MEKVIAVNRKARHEYFLEEFYEAGIALTGTEIKSVRKGHVEFKDAYIDFVGNEAFIRDMHIAQYDHGNIFNHDETRLRKLLLQLLNQLQNQLLLLQLQLQLQLPNLLLLQAVPALL